LLHESASEPGKPWIDAAARLEQNVSNRRMTRAARTGFRAMPSKGPHRLILTAVAAAALVLGACSLSSEQSSSSDLARKLRLTRPDSPHSMQLSGDARAALTAEDLIGPDGRCPGDPASPAGEPGSGALYFQAGPEAGRGPNAAPLPTAPGSAQPGSAVPGRRIALEISECDLVHAAGYTNQVEISTNERGERSVVLTYLSGDQRGIYRFVSGRLKSIERAPEPPAPEKPAPKKPAKKPASS
jgi:hypothetical protein